jgi:guanylate kinase
MAKIFIISGPSGSGQDSVINGLKEKIEFDKIITTTTRKMRPEDQEGKTYYFISKEEFQEGIRDGRFFEHALEDNGNYYGGTYAELERVKKSSIPVIWKIDYKGVIAAKKLLPEAKSIFIHIPKDLIEKRLRKRGETAETIQSRIKYADGWYENEEIFDYKITNEEDKLDETVEKARKIISGDL